jgi:hypothetical protein
MDDPQRKVAVFPLTATKGTSSRVTIDNTLTVQHVDCLKIQHEFVKLQKNSCKIKGAVT